MQSVPGACMLCHICSSLYYCDVMSVFSYMFKVLVYTADKLHLSSRYAKTLSRLGHAMEPVMWQLDKDENWGWLKSHLSLTSNVGWRDSEDPNHISDQASDHHLWSLVVEAFVAETQSHVGLTWDKAHSVANQWVYLMNYKTYILKRYSRKFPKLPPDHNVGLISQQHLLGVSMRSAIVLLWWRNYCLPSWVGQYLLLLIVKSSFTCY